MAAAVRGELKAGSKSGPDLVLTALGLLDPDAALGDTGFFAAKVAEVVFMNPAAASRHAAVLHIEKQDEKHEGETKTNGSKGVKGDMKQKLEHLKSYQYFSGKAGGRYFRHNLPGSPLGNILTRERP